MSQIATTIKQSKLLLDAGLSDETADMILVYTMKDSVSTKYRLLVKQPWHTEKRLQNLDTSWIPAWSLSRLWEILNTADVYYYSFDTGDGVSYVIDSLVEAVIRLVKSKKNHDDGK